MEEAGLQIEREKEEDFRKEKQMGVDADWTYDGKMTQLNLPEPFKKRPRLGARYLVRNELSKLIHPIVRELKDKININSRLKALKLLE